MPQRARAIPENLCPWSRALDHKLRGRRQCVTCKSHHLNKKGFGLDDLPATFFPTERFLPKTFCSEASPRLESLSLSEERFLANPKVSGPEVTAQHLGSTLWGPFVSQQPRNQFHPNAGFSWSKRQQGVTSAMLPLLQGSTGSQSITLSQDRNEGPELTPSHDACVRALGQPYIKAPQRSGLNHRNVPSPSSGGSEGQGVGGATSFSGCEENQSRLSPSFWGFAGNLCRSLASRCIARISAFIFTWHLPA